MNNQTRGDQELEEYSTGSSNSGTVSKVALLGKSKVDYDKLVPNTSYLVGYTLMCCLGSC